LESVARAGKRRGACKNDGGSTLLLEQNSFVAQRPLHQRPGLTGVTVRRRKGSTFDADLHPGRPPAFGPGCDSQSIWKSTDGDAHEGEVPEQAGRFEQKERSRGIAPLGTPFVLIVDPASHCNFKCRFCPTGDLELIKATGRYQGSMAFDTFKKIIDDLQEFPEPVRVLRLYKEGEPLMNKRFADMVRYARGSG
jgi:hypothetical protein